MHILAVPGDGGGGGDYGDEPGRAGTVAGCPVAAVVVVAVAAGDGPPATGGDAASVGLVAALDDVQLAVEQSDAAAAMGPVAKIPDDAAGDDEARPTGDGGGLHVGRAGWLGLGLVEVVAAAAVAEGDGWPRPAESPACAGVGHQAAAAVAASFEGANLHSLAAGLLLRH